MNDISEKKHESVSFTVVLLAAFLIRMILACFYEGYTPDQEGLVMWGIRLVQVGPGRFYSPDVQMPYPPLYLWLMYLVSAVTGIDHIEVFKMAVFYLKMIPILFDLASGVLIYTVMKKKGDRQAVLLSAMYLFNPAVLFNSAVWGQTDGCFTFFVALMCVFLEEKKTDRAVVAFCAGCLIKQQTAVFLPVLIAGVIRDLLSPDRKRNILTILRGCICSAILFFAISFPFHISKVIGCYFDTLSTYSCASYNAWNFWSLMRLNITDVSGKWVFDISINTWGNIMLGCILLLFGIKVVCGKKVKNCFPLLGAMIIIPVFTFWTAMHERYLFSGLILLLLSYVYLKNKGFLYFYIVFSILQLMNVWQIYAMNMFTYFGEIFFLKYPVAIMLFVSAATVTATLCFYVFAFRSVPGGGKQAEAEDT